MSDPDQARFAIRLGSAAAAGAAASASSQNTNGTAQDGALVEQGAVAEADDPRTPTRARPKMRIHDPSEDSGIGGDAAQDASMLTPVEQLPPMLPASALLASVTANPDHSACEQEQDRASESEAGNVSAVSAASSPDVDKPIINKVSVALQRGDSTSSDSSTSNLSRASSSSSVYATPFRMTPFRTPLGTGSRAGSTTGDRNSYFPSLVPPRFGNNRGYSSARSSFTGSLPQRFANNGSSSTAVVVQDVTAPAVLPVVAEANGTGYASHRPSGSNATIGPTAAAAYAAEARTSPRGRSPQLPTAASVFAGDGSAATATTSSVVVTPANGIMRSPPSPAAELIMQQSNSAQGNLLRPIRPGMGSRTASNASLGNNFHKRASDFDLGEVLGEGSYSTVFLATDKFPPHRQYALKVLDKKHIIKERKVKYVNVEKETLARLDRHPGIVRLYWTFHDERSLYFVLELASKGEILKYIKDYGSFDTVSARFYAAQVICAVHHMHNKGVIHRDLKPENILLDANMRVKITDFGTAKLLSPSGSYENLTAEEVMQSRSNSFVGTAQYVSPELLTAKPISTGSVDADGNAKPLPPPHAADFWAFGCVLYQFITGKTPFRAPNEYLIFQKITKLEYDFPAEFPEDARDLVSKLLVLDPLQRLGSKRGVEEIKEHRFFASIDWNTIWTQDVPPMQTGITPPTVYAPQILALEESSIDASGDEGDAEESIFPEDEEEKEPTQPRLAPLASPPMDMLPAPPSPSPRGRHHEPPWAKSNGRLSGSVRSSNSSRCVESRNGRRGSASTNGSWQASQTGMQPLTDEQQGRSRSSSSGTSRWMKIFSMPKNALQRVKAPTTAKRKGSTDSRAT